MNSSESRKQLLLKELTDGERELFCILVSGYSKRESAAKLRIPLKTAARMTSSLYEKLSVITQAQLIIEYRHFYTIEEDNP